MLTVSGRSAEKLTIAKVEKVSCCERRDRSTTAKIRWRGLYEYGKKTNISCFSLTSHLERQAPVPVCALDGQQPESCFSINFETCPWRHTIVVRRE